MKRALSLCAAATLAGCASPSTTTNPQDEFFAALTAHCGKGYVGRLVTDQAADAEMRGKTMVMDIRNCTPDRIEIPFAIESATWKDGWDRSRTWIISRTPAGLRLKHDHRHADGQPDAVTLYGGDTDGPGSATRQTFPVDAESIAMFQANGMTASVTNVWAIETTATGFAYELRREGRHFRVAFDYDRPAGRMMASQPQ